ncbi:TPA: EpsG family protein [Elizabethkingia anophelis]
MYLYIIFLLLCTFSFYEFWGGKKRIVNILFVLFFSTLFILSWIRWERGTDWNNYLLFFNYIDAAYETGIEKGYIYLSVFSKAIDNDYTLFLLFQAIIIYGLTYASIKLYSPYKFLSLLVWFSFAFAGIFFVRQSIAITLGLFSFQYILKRKLLNYIMFIILASFFHRTALVLLPFYFIVNYKIQKKYIFLLLIAVFLSSALAKNLLANLPFVNTAISMRLEGYLDSSQNKGFGSAFSPFETMVRGSVYRIFLILIFVVYFYNEILKDQKKYILFNLYFYGTLFFILLVPISTVMIRFSSYFEISQILLIPILLYDVKKAKIKGLFLLSLFIFSLIRFIGVVKGYEDLYIPYKSIFNKDLPVKTF